MKKFTRIAALVLTLCLLLSAAALAATPPAKPSGSGSGSGGSSSSAPSSYDSVYDITSNKAYDGVTLSSVTGDQNVVHVYNGASMVITNSTVSNTGSGSGGDDSSFYGVGSSLFVSSGKLYVDDTTITTTGTGNAGVFAYSGGTAYVSDTTISTNGSSAGGLHVAGGGTLYAWNCNVTTSATSASAAIRSDRGGGTMVIDGGTYNTKGGTGAVYVTADITVHNATLISGASEAVAMEGRNTLRLFDCDLSGTMTSSGQNSGTVSTWGIILYQSMSGDSEVGTAVFQMDGGSLNVTAPNGPLFYTTNTSSVFTLRNVAITSNCNKLLVVAGNDNSRGWGTSGSNGATCTFTAYNQTLNGTVAYDSISTMNLYLLDGSHLTGAITKDDSLNGGKSGSKTSNVYVGSGSTWTVTGNSTVNGTLYNAGTIENAKIVNTSGKTLATFGSGTYTVTVGAYSTSVSTSGAGTLSSWSSYAVANPFTSGTVPSIDPSTPVSGNVKTGWNQVSGAWYYYDDEGSLKTGWLEMIGAKYYLDPDTGKMATGWKSIDGSWYYFNTSGVMQTGWIKLSGTWYYLDTDGRMLADEWVGNYYLKSNGAMATGWVQDGEGNWMLFSSAGKQLTGWQKSGSTWYYLDPDNSGIMATDWCAVGETWYYFGTNGAMRTGWQKLDDVWYYFGTNGAMRTGWQKISSKWYFFDDAGMMQSDCWTTDGYYLTSSGAMATGWAQDPYGEWYLFNSSGKMLTGWQKSGSSWYYLDPEIGNMYYDGVYYIEAEGRYAEFAANGAWLSYVDEPAA